MFVLFLIFAVIAIGAWAVAFFVRNKTDKIGTRIFAGVATAGMVLFLLLGSFVQVGTKNLGVITTFGRPTGSLDNGLHLKWPWQDVTDISDRVQTDTYASDNGATGNKQQGAVGNCVTIRIARQATACINVSVRWQIQESGVDYLFRNYKDNDAITDNLVLRDLQVAMNETMTDYNPYNLDANGNSLNKPLSATTGASYSVDVQKDLQGAMPAVNGQPVISIQSVNLPLIQYDTKTQTNLNAILAQIAQTQIADQSKATADAQAAANNALASSVDNSPGVLQSKCLDILKESIDKGIQLPAGFSCFGATSANIAVGAK